jgi:hypothetical protein
LSDLCSKSLAAANDREGAAAQLAPSPNGNPGQIAERSGSTKATVSPGRRYVAIEFTKNDQSQFGIFDAVTGELLFGRVGANVAFSPDDEVINFTSPAVPKQERSNARVALTITALPQGDDRHTSEFSTEPTVVFDSPRARTLAFTDEAKLIDYRSGQIVGTAEKLQSIGRLGSTAQVWRLGFQQFSPSGRFVVFNGNVSTQFRKVFLWDVVQGGIKQLDTLWSESAGSRIAVFAADDTRLLLAGRAQDANAVSPSPFGAPRLEVIEPTSGKQLPVPSGETRLGPPSDASGVVFSDLGLAILTEAKANSASARTLLWDLKSSRQLAEISTERVASLAPTIDGRSFITTDRVYNAESGHSRPLSQTLSAYWPEYVTEHATGPGRTTQGSSNRSIGAWGGRTLSIPLRCVVVLRSTSEAYLVDSATGAVTSLPVPMTASLVATPDLTKIVALANQNAAHISVWDLRPATSSRRFRCFLSSAQPVRAAARHSYWAAHPMVGC